MEDITMYISFDEIDQFKGDKREAEYISEKRISILSSILRWLIVSPFIIIAIVYIQMPFYTSLLAFPLIGIVIRTAWFDVQQYPAKWEIKILRKFFKNFIDDPVIKIKESFRNTEAGKKVLSLIAESQQDPELLKNLYKEKVLLQTKIRTTIDSYNAKLDADLKPLQDAIDSLRTASNKKCESEITPIKNNIFRIEDKIKAMEVSL